MLLALFLMFALLDVVTTYVGLQRGLREGHPLLKYLDKEFIPVVQVALYSPVFIFFEQMPLWAQIVSIILPALALTNNLRKLKVV